MRQPLRDSCCTAATTPSSPIPSRTQHTGARRWTPPPAPPEAGKRTDCSRNPGHRQKAVRNPAFPSIPTIDRPGSIARDALLRGGARIFWLGSTFCRCALGLCRLHLHLWCYVRQHIHRPLSGRDRAPHRIEVVRSSPSLAVSFGIPRSIFSMIMRPCLIGAWSARTVSRGQWLRGRASRSEPPAQQALVPDDAPIAVGHEPGPVESQARHASAPRPAIHLPNAPAAGKTSLHRSLPTKWLTTSPRSHWPYETS